MRSCVCYGEVPADLFVVFYWLFIFGQRVLVYIMLDISDFTDNKRVL